MCCSQLTAGGPGSCCTPPSSLPSRTRSTTSPGVLLDARLGRRWPFTREKGTTNGARARKPYQPIRVPARAASAGSGCRTARVRSSAGRVWEVVVRVGAHPTPAEEGVLDEERRHQELRAALQAPN